jgi:thiamine pyrophosphate-dependent acetolactate synthase large subunit-like protein
LAAKGLFGRDKYDLGVFGTLSSPPAVDAIMASDCIIAVGASLNEFTGGGDGWPYFRGKRVVHCDVNPAALGTEYLADALVRADATIFARTSIDWLKHADYTSSGFRGTIKLGSGEVTAKPSSSEFVDLIEALVELNRALPIERAITVDGGRFAWEAIKRLDVPRARCWASTFRGFGAVGNALSAAIGVGIALPGLPTVAVVGDGGFMIGGLAEFSTAVRYGVDLIAFVCNDGTYGAEYGKLVTHGLSTETSFVDWPDFAPVAESLGGAGYTIRNAAELAGLGSVIADRHRPLLIDVKLDPTASPKEY